MPSRPNVPVKHGQIEWGPEIIHDLRLLLRLAIREDLERGVDITSLPLVPADAVGQANVVAREPGVIAGLGTGNLLREELNCPLEWDMLCEDGQLVEAGQSVATIRGPARDIFVAERTLLNTVGHLSGVATLTRAFVDKVHGTSACVCDTRKTIPGWRNLEKYAVACGGGTNHRRGLYDAVLIKDNHLAFGASRQDPSWTIAQSVEKTRQYAQSRKHPVIIQVEVDSMRQFQQVIPANPDIVLLDNMTTDQLVEAVALRNAEAPQIRLEASGGVRWETIRAIAETGVDRISVGALTHSARQLDVGLDWCDANV